MITHFDDHFSGYSTCCNQFRAICGSFHCLLLFSFLDIHLAGILFTNNRIPVTDLLGGKVVMLGGNFSAASEENYPQLLALSIYCIDQSLMFGSMMIHPFVCDFIYHLMTRFIVLKCPSLGAMEYLLSACIAYLMSNIQRVMTSCKLND